MRRRSKILLLGACVLLALVAVCYFCLPEKEPSYNGRTFTEWIARFGAIEGTDRVAMEQRREAERAIRTIGTNGVPVLLRKLKQVERETGYERMLKHSPHFLQNIRERVVERKLSDCAFIDEGFGILGTNAACALPQLERQFSAGTELIASSSAIEAIGPAGLDFFLGVIKAGGKTIQRYTAITSVAHMPMREDVDANMLQAVPVLLAVATNQSDCLSGIAFTALGMFHLPPKQLLPICINRLTFTNAQERCLALDTLRQLGTNARPALRGIELALGDSDPNVRLYATNALVAIAPERLTNSEPLQN